MQARRLLAQAIANFEQRGDKAGLAEAYRQSGLLSRYGGAQEDAVLISWEKGGPKPSPAELDISDRYLSRAAGFAAEGGRPDLVSNIYYLLGVNQVLRGDAPRACPLYDRALAASREAEAQRPGLAVDLPPGVHSFPEGIARAKAAAQCPG
jgi:hypothetical protein